MSTKSHANQSANPSPLKTNFVIADHHVAHLAEQSFSNRDEERSQLIAVCAYGLWEKAGMPDGDAAREKKLCEAEKQVMTSRTNDRLEC